ncbi:cupin domain-containing protein [Streptomyces sp. ID05-26A]|nr:cupin domain-containing protein [Streptomyces sp. ID05-26A]
MTTILTAGTGEITGDPAAVTDRYLTSCDRFALVEHAMAPRALAAPVHRHSREDEYSFVLEGKVGVLLGEEEIVGGPGDLIFKPRGQWHTFWNAGDEPARVLEIISPSGLEHLFRALGALTEPPAPSALADMAAEYGCDVDFAATGPLAERHGLLF